MSGEDKLTLDLIKSLVENDKCHLLTRNPDQVNIYESFQKEILTTWVSMNDYIKSRYLSAYERINMDGKKYSVFPNHNSSYVIAYNRFPYYIEDNLKHMVLWATEALSEKEVEEILASHFGKDKGNRYWFEQPVEQKSIKGVWHVHIFVDASSVDAKYLQ
ncbi:Domain of unknown function (DUF3605)-containing protein [uncultured virus]|nr:Domain of unknown function (DUF3605)-containing protein [uncultured virus]